MMEARRNRETGRTFRNSLVCFSSTVGLIAFCWVVLFGLAALGEGDEAWLRSQIGGPCEASFMDGDMLFVGEGPNLRIFDLSGSAGPVPLGSVRLPDRPLAINVFAARCYAACGPAGLWVVDVSEPSMPRVLGSYEPKGSVRNVTVADRAVGPTAFCLIGDRVGIPGALDVLRFEDYAVTETASFAPAGGILRMNDEPITYTHPVVVGSYMALADPQDVAVFGDIVFVANGDLGLEILRAEDRSISDTVVGEIGPFQTKGSAQGVESFFDRANVVVCTRQGLQIVNATIPERPMETAFYMMRGGADDAFISGTTVLASGLPGVQLLEVDDAIVTYTKVTLLGTAPTLGFPGALAADPARGLLAAAEGEYGFELFDVAQPSMPIRRHHHVLLGNPSAIQFDPSSNVAIVANANGYFDLLDFTEPTYSTEIVSLSLTGESPLDSEPIQLVFTSPTLIVADALRGLDVFHIDSIVSPTLVASYQTRGAAAGLFVEGNLAYVAETGSAILEIVDVSDPTSPTFVGVWEGPGEGHNVFVSNKFAHLAAGVGGLQLVDVRNPQSPTPGGNFSADSFFDVYVDLDDGLSYAAAKSGLVILDMMDAMGNVLKGSQPTSAPATVVQVRGNMAIVGTDGAGVAIFGIGRPETPSITGIYVVPGSIRDFYLFGDLIYVLTDKYGLWVIDGRTAARPSWDRYR